jgi:hypothetical protein
VNRALFILAAAVIILAAIFTGNGSAVAKALAFGISCRRPQQ